MTDQIDPMQILLLSQWFDPEPGATKGLPLAHWLENRGHKVKALTGFPNYPGGKVYEGYKIKPWQRQNMEGIDVLRVPLYPSHDTSAFERIANFASFALSAATIGTAKIGPADVGYVYHPPPTIGLAAYMIKKLRNVPFAYHIADMWPDTVLESGMIGSWRARSIAEPMINAWCNWVYRQSAAITVLSPGFKDLLIERGVPEEKIHVIYNWADEDAFFPEKIDNELADRLGLKGKFNIMYSGNLGPMQGLETVIRAAREVRDDFPDLQVVIAGGGHEEEKLIALANEISATNVLFLGRRPFQEMNAINAIADVLVVHLRDLPFFSSTIPGKTQVSLSSGRPTLMAVRGDASGLIERADAGLSCEPENPMAMADAMRTFATMPKKRLIQIGQNARTYYSEQICMEVGAKKTEEILQNIRAKR